MKHIKKSLSIVLALLLMGVFAVAPISADARVLNDSVKANWEKLKTYLRENNGYKENKSDGDDNVGYWNEDAIISINDETVVFSIRYYYSGGESDANTSYNKRLSGEFDYHNLITCNISGGNRDEEYLGHTSFCIEDFDNASKYITSYSYEDLGPGVDPLSAERMYDEVHSIVDRFESILYNILGIGFEDLGFGVPLEKGGAINICSFRGIKDKTYNGKLQTQNITVIDGSFVLKKDSDYTVSYKNNKNVGTTIVTIIGKGKYTGKIMKSFKITKAKNPMTVTSFNKSVKYKTIEKKNVTVTALSVKKSQGKKVFQKTSGNKRITINSKTGKITVKKGIKKGKYTVKVKVTAKGNSNYKSASKTVKVIIKVK